VVKNDINHHSMYLSLYFCWLGQNIGYSILRGGSTICILLSAKVALMELIDHKGNVTIADIATIRLFRYIF